MKQVAALMPWHARPRCRSQPAHSRSRTSGSSRDPLRLLAGYRRLGEFSGGRRLGQRQRFRLHHLSNLKFAFMGTLEGHKGGSDSSPISCTWMSAARNRRLGTSPSATTNFPAGVTADLGLGLKGTVWTLAGSYRVSNDPSTSVDVLAGARLLDIKLDLSYSLSADVGPFSGPGRAGNSDINKSYWDAIIGAKGRVVFGSNREWFVPYYVDVGTGESDLTWQIFGGLGYQFSWGSSPGWLALPRLQVQVRQPTCKT